MKKIKLSSRDAILEAAFQTFNEKPGASLGDVADRAGVGRATLHRHFSSRQTLMVALAKTALKELNEAIDTATADAQSHTEGLRLSLAAVIPLANRQWFLSHETLEDDPDIANAHKKEVAVLHREIEAARAEGSFAADLPTMWIAEAYENLIYAAWTMVREEEATPTQAADMAWRTFIKGVSQ
ncbi:MAG: TetR/AcrR family transcriptional regulator [Pseudomonadota bacterium]